MLAVLLHPAHPVADKVLALQAHRAQAADLCLKPPQRTVAVTMHGPDPAPAMLCSWIVHSGKILTRPCRLYSIRQSPDLITIP